MLIDIITGKVFSILIFRGKDFRGHPCLDLSQFKYAGLYSTKGQNGEK